jgi:hypothetical protein
VRDQFEIITRMTDPKRPSPGFVVLRGEWRIAQEN